MPQDSVFEQANKVISNTLDSLYSVSIAYVLMILLLGTGIYFTLKTRGFQFYMFGHMIKLVLRSRKGARGGISSFQAFAIGLADRVGTGAIAGVALAVVAGGPGTVFWMWIVAILGMVTAFVESTLAQLFKTKTKAGFFIGGPAYYIQKGLGSRFWGAVFAVLLIFAYAFSFEMIQSNSISQLASLAFEVPSWVSALILVAMTLPLVLGGIRPIARLTEYLAPLMALVYLLMALVIIALNWQTIPFVFKEILAGAFGQGSYVPPSVAGASGAFMVALQNGVKRGLFTNEAGMGSAPNAAATATVEHPVNQGLVQALGVFVDTMMVCTATALIILVSQPFWVQDAHTLDGTALTAASMVSSLAFGDNTQTIVSVFVLAMMLSFGYSTILGNYAYAETNYKYLVGINKSPLPLKLLVIFATCLGALLPLHSVWSLADWASALMAIVNLVAIVLLGKLALGALKDYCAQRKAGVEVPVFHSVDNPYMPEHFESEVWCEAGGYLDSWFEFEEK